MRPAITEDDLERSRRTRLSRREIEQIEAAEARLELIERGKCIE